MKIKIALFLGLLLIMTSSVGYAETITLDVQTWKEGDIARAATDLFFYRVNQKLDDYTIETNYYSHGEIADSGEMISAMEGGLLDITFGESPSWVSGYDSRLEILELPFLWEDKLDLQKNMVEKELGQKLEEIMIEKANTRVLMWYIVGSRWMYFNERITSIEDLQGISMRTPEAKTYLDMMDIIGFDATTVTWGEVFTSLETGLVDGMESPPSLVYSEGFYEALDYMWETNHMITPQFGIINERVWKELPQEVQSAMEEAGEEVSWLIYGLTLKKELEAVEIMKERGLELIDDVDPSPLLDLFKDYNMEWAERNNAVELMNMVLEDK